MKQITFACLSYQQIPLNSRLQLHLAELCPSSATGFTFEGETLHRMTKMTLRTNCRITKLKSTLVAQRGLRVGRGQRVPE